MKKLKGTVIITKRSQTREPYRSIGIEINDNDSGCRIALVELSLEQFATALTASHGDAEITLYESPHYGMKRVGKTVQMPRPKWAATKEELKAIAAPFEVDGWKADLSDLTNHHQWSSKDTVNVHMTKYVPVEEGGQVMTSEQVKEATGYLHRAITASVFDTPAEEVPQLHERLDKLVRHIEEQGAEIERLRKRDGNAEISLLLPTETNPFERSDAHVLDFGVADNCYLVESPEVNKLRADLIAETKSHAETAGFLQDRKDQLAAIRSTLAAVLGDGDAVTLAELAANVMLAMAAKNGPYADYSGDECRKRLQEAAVEAVKGGAVVIPPLAEPMEIQSPERATYRDATVKWTKGGSNAER